MSKNDDIDSVEECSKNADDDGQVPMNGLVSVLKQGEESESFQMQEANTNTIRKCCVIAFLTSVLM